MRDRQISHREIEEVLASMTKHVFTPKHSTRVEGSTSDGRVLRIWIAGTDWPPKEPLRIKTVAPKGSSR